MLRSLHRFARTAALVAAFVALPALADAGERSGRGGSEGGFGSGAVFVGRGGEVNRGRSFGFGEERGVAVVGGTGGGRWSSVERYYDGRRYEAPSVDGFRYRADRGRYDDRGAIGIGRSGRGLDGRDLNRQRLEARREAFEARRRGASDGSFIRLRDSGRIDRFGPDPRYQSRREEGSRAFRDGRDYGSFDQGDWSGRGIVSYQSYSDYALGQGLPGRAGSTGPKIMNVERERLDRRPIGRTGLDVVVTDGGAKIIRIAPGYRMAKATEIAPRPAVRNDGSLHLQPWSTGWLRYCQNTHASFDSDLGTYVTPDGRVRFCTAE